MAKKYDAAHARAALIERLAENDPVFKRNYTAAMQNQKYRQLIPCVTAWQIRSALARERRQEQQQQRTYAPSRSVGAVERELFG